MKVVGIMVGVTGRCGNASAVTVPAGPPRETCHPRSWRGARDQGGGTLEGSVGRVPTATMAE